MKLDQLRKIIREEVRAAVKEELQDVITEAVTIASTPTTKPAVEKLSTVETKPTKQELAEMMGLQTPPKATNIQYSKNSTMQEMLAQTQASMTSEDYRGVINATSDMVKKPNFASTMANSMSMSAGGPGLDLSQLSFVKNAKKIYDKAVEKSKNV